MSNSIRAVFISIILAWTAAARLPSGEPNLPSFPELWQAVKPNLMRQYEETELLKGYTYRRDASVSELEKSGAVKRTERSQYEVYYFDHGPFSKLVSKNGVPLSEKELKKQDEEMEKFRRQGPSRRGGPWRGRNRQLSAKDRDELLMDVYNGFDFKVVRREVNRGRNTIVIDFSPRRNARLRTRAAKMVFPKLEGAAWIDETDHIVVQLKAGMLKDLKVGGGLLASIDDVSEYQREWLKINDEVWLPSRYEMRLKGRLLLAQGVNVRRVDEFSDYRKFSVETRIQVLDGPQ
jgi:hypothetical protein